MRVIEGMYDNARSHVQVNGQYSEEFSMGVGVHQGSVLSPPFIILVLEALPHEFYTVCHVFLMLMTCSQCMLWVYKKCSGITKQLMASPNYVRRRCNGEAWPIDGRDVTKVDIGDAMLDATFCYLGGMLCSGGSYDSAITVRFVACGTFRKLLPVLTTRHLSPGIRSKVCEACVSLAMVQSRQTWGPNNPELQWISRNDRAMIRCICGTKEINETPSASILQQIGIDDITTALNTLGPRQNGRHFAYDIFKRICVNKNIWIPIKISLKFVPKGSINSIPALVQIMAWRRPGDKPLSESMMASLLTHICVTRPQWVNRRRLR